VYLQIDTMKECMCVERVNLVTNNELESNHMKYELIQIV